MTMKCKANIADDNISVGEESPEETYVTINDINIVREMNMGEEMNNEAVAAPNNHEYNLWPSLTKRNPNYALVQNKNQLIMRGKRI